MGAEGLSRAKKFGKRCDHILIDGVTEGRFPHSLNIHGAVGHHCDARGREDGGKVREPLLPSLPRALCWHLGTRGVSAAMRRPTPGFARFRGQEGRPSVRPSAVGGTGAGVCFP